MTSSCQMLSTTRRLLAAVAALACASAAFAGTASAATAECEGVDVTCISVFSSELGTYADVGFVEAVLGSGAARVGQPVGLKAASSFDSSEDIRPVPGKVSDFHALGQVSDAANSRYGGLRAVKQRYAPLGVVTDLCVGLARVAYQNAGLTLQPCDSPTTIWIINAYPTTADGYFPIINATTTDFNRPFAMHLPRNSVASGRPLQMQARRLQFHTDELTGERTLPARQLWGAVFGVLD